MMHHPDANRAAGMRLRVVIASEAKQSRNRIMDCFVGFASSQ